MSLLSPFIFQQVMFLLVFIMEFHSSKWSLGCPVWALPGHPVIVTGKCLILNWEPHMDSSLDLITSLNHCSPGFSVKRVGGACFHFHQSKWRSSHKHLFSFLTFVIISYCMIVGLGERRQFKVFLFQLHQNIRPHNAFIHKAVYHLSYC